MFSFDDPAKIDEPSFRPSVVTIEIEPGEDIVKLTIIHAELRTTGEREAIGHGWPAVLANLKTLLETGETLPQAPWELESAMQPQEV